MTYQNSKEYLRKKIYIISYYKIELFVTLSLLGILLFGVCFLDYPQITNHKSELLTLSTSLIVSALIALILFPMEEDIIKSITEYNNDSLSILRDCHNCGFIRVLDTRKNNPELKKILDYHMNSKKIYMMGTTLEDFFLEDGAYHEIFLKLLTDSKTQFAIVILDLTSEGVMEEAVKLDIGKSKFISEHSGDITNTKLYHTLQHVTEYLHEICIPDQERRFYIKYTKRLPHSFVICTDSCSIIEPYDMGVLKDINLSKIMKEHAKLERHGGYSPCYIVKRHSNYSKLLESYIQHELDDPENNDIDTIYKKLKVTK